jgi:hypothetical protein
MCEKWMIVVTTDVGLTPRLKRWRHWQVQSYRCRLWSHHTCWNGVWTHDLSMQLRCWSGCTTQMGNQRQVRQVGARAMMATVPKLIVVSSLQLNTLVIDFLTETGIDAWEMKDCLYNQCRTYTSFEAWGHWQVQSHQSRSYHACWNGARNLIVQLRRHKLGCSTWSRKPRTSWASGARAMTHAAQDAVRGHLAERWACMPPEGQHTPEVHLQQVSVKSMWCWKGAQTRGKVWCVASSEKTWPMMQWQPNDG